MSCTSARPRPCNCLNSRSRLSTICIACGANGAAPLLHAAVGLLDDGAEAAAAEGEARMHTALRADARALARRAALGDDPDAARPVVNLVGTADERHAVAVGHSPRDADLFAAEAVGVVVDAADGRLLAGGVKEGACDENP